MRFAGKPVYLLVNAPVRLSEAAADEPCVGRLSAAVQCLPSTLPSSTPSLPCGAMWRWLLLLGVLARGGPSGDESETSWKSDPEPWDELENQDDPADARGERMDSQDDSVREDASENMDEDVGGSQGRLLWSPDPKDWKLGGLRLLLQVHGVPEEAEAEEWADPARGDPSPEEPDHDSELPEGREAPSLEAQVHEPELPGEDLRGGAQEPGEPGLPREEEGAPVPLYDRDGQQSLYPPREVRMGRGGDHNLGDDPSMGRDDLEPRTLRELLGDGRELRRGQPRLPLASVLGDGRDLRRGQRAERGRRAEYEPGSTQGENNDAGMPQHGGDQVPHSDEGGLREEEENGAPDTASTGAIGIEFGYMYGGSWISVNDLVDWLFQVGGGMDGEWPSIKDLVQRAASKYAEYIGEPGVMMDKETAITKERRTHRLLPQGVRMEWSADGVNGEKVEIAGINLLVNYDLLDELNMTPTLRKRSQVILRRHPRRKWEDI